MKNIIIFTLLLFSTVTNIFSQPPDSCLNDKAYSILNNQSISYPFSYIVMGDTRKGVPDSTYDELSVNWIEIMNQIKTTDFPNSYQFITILGDLILGNDTLSRMVEQYEQFYEFTNDFMDSTGKPVISVPGNHDLVGSHGDTLFTQYVGKLYDYFDVLDSRFLYIENNYYRGIYPSQMSWINNTALSDSTNCPDNIISLAHYPFFRYYPHATDTVMNRPNFKNYYNTLVAKGCKVHFAGHFHDYMRHYDCNTDFFNITTGGGGAKLAHDTIHNPDTLFHKFHFLYITMYADGSLKTEVYFKEDGHNSVAAQGDFWVSGENFEENHILTGSETDTKNYFATESIMAAGNSTTYTINPNSDITMVVRKEGHTTLKPGFEAKNGSVLEVTIRGFECEDLSELY